MSSASLIADRKSAIDFVQWYVAVLGPCYHPDTPFAEYLDGDGQAVFSAGESAWLDELTDCAFACCDLNTIGAAEFERIPGLYADPSQAD